MSKLIEVKNLNVTFHDLAGTLHAVTDLNFSIEKGEVLGVIGESGSGKSVTSKAIMGFLNSKNVEGEILYEGKNLLKMKEKDMCKLRGSKISLVFQEPMTALNPVMTIGKQLEEVLVLHKKGDKNSNLEKIKETLRLMNISDPDAMLSKYPFELSGGLRQRIMIAMAVLCEPDLIIADEPTTALDVTTQMEILKLLKNVTKIMGCSVLLITHDLGVIAECADRVIVMYRGRKMEECNMEDLFDCAMHPYAHGLILSRPSNFQGRYYTIEGTVESNYGNNRGCLFQKRCKYCSEKCKNEVPLEQVFNGDHSVFCWNVEEVNRGEKEWIK